MGEIWRDVPEESVHPHVPAERADLFSAIDPKGAELETLNLINALIYSLKPELVLETGTGGGFTTLAIAAAQWPSRKGSRSR